MKDELRLYCINEGVCELYLRAQIEADKRLSRQKKKHEKKKRLSPRESQTSFIKQGKN